MLNEDKTNFSEPIIFGLVIRKKDKIIVNAKSQKFTYARFNHLERKEKIDLTDCVQPTISTKTKMNPR